jgi:hypothetical protein
VRRVPEADDELQGSPELFQRLVDGHRDDDRFLVLESGEKVEADVTSPGTIKARPAVVAQGEKR